MTSAETYARSSFLAVSLVASLLLGSCASPPYADGVDVAQRIENARSRTDHEWAADYYRQQEARSREQALQHRKLGDKYASWGAEFGRSSWGPRMATHCRNLVERYERSADDYAALARLHQQMAVQAPQ